LGVGFASEASWPLEPFFSMGPSNGRVFRIALQIVEIAITSPVWRSPPGRVGERLL
jgi:hypothetical protein